MLKKRNMARRKLDCDTVEKAAKMQGCPRNGPEEKPLTFQLVSQYFCMPTQELNVGGAYASEEEIQGARHSAVAAAAR